MYVALAESMVQVLIGVPLVVSVCAPATVSTLPPISMNKGSPLYPGQATCGLGDSFPL